MKAATTTQSSAAKVATIGFFDGVHLGHRCLISQVCDEARRRSMPSMVITFDQHPRKVLDADYQPQLLSTLAEKEALLRSTGVDVCHIMPFTRELSMLTAREFMQEVLRDQLGVRVLVMGYDHHFGHGGGSMEKYVAWGTEVGIEVVRAKELCRMKASSSIVRRHLAEGNVEEANSVLGYAYSLTGRVVEGRQMGHQLGFPTANLHPADDKLVPACGVYAVEVMMPGGEHRMGMLNIGQRPTLHNGTDTTYEVHILDYEGDLYGQTLTLSLRSRIRSEQTFASLQALSRQLALDAEETRRVLAAHDFKQ